MATRYATASQSDSSLGSNEWLEGFSPQTLRPIISKDSESKYMSATNINPYDTLIARPCDSDDDPLLGPPKQQPRGTGTIAPTGLDSIQQTIKDVMRESIKDLKNDILAPLAQRIIDIEERVEKIEIKMESANTKTAQQNKEAQKRNRQNDSDQMGRPRETIIRISNTNNKCFQDNKKLCTRGQETNALLCIHIFPYTVRNRNVRHCIQETNKKGTNKTEQSNKSAPQQKLLYADHTTP